MRSCIHLYYMCTLVSASFSTAFKGSSAGLESRVIHLAKSVREKIAIGAPSPDAVSLAYPSAYSKPDGSGYRGFCNWLIPRHVMVGQYPGQNPEVNGPNVQEVQSHIQCIVQDAGVDLFCCLQSEVPAQDDFTTWKKAGGETFLPFYLRGEFPNAFTHYAPYVLSASQSRNDPIFLHSPIEDLNVPNSEPLLLLLSQLLEALESGCTLYLHCWGGRGRAGLVGACLVSLIWPEMNSSSVLDLVQTGYESRAGADAMAPALSRSPQTESQREFVRKFVQNQNRRQVE
mmetsp:Transcript_33215/g.49504  ORF Transcript_33215/g.49504 Transcript_33215/m.49504 type:complete len:286 (-) Transcript_33215:153-1010(-)